MIIEAVRNLELKQKIFQEVEQYASENAVFATNTSSLSIGKITGDKSPRTIDWDAFLTLTIMKLLELVKHAELAKRRSICQRGWLSHAKNHHIGQ